MAISKLDIQRPETGTLEIVVSGDWKTGQEKPYPSDISTLVSDHGVRRIQFDSRDLGTWDSALAVFLAHLTAYCESTGIAVDPEGLPSGARRLLALAAAVPRKEDAGKETRALSPLGRIGNAGFRAYDSVRDVLEFIGELALSFQRLLRGQARFRMEDVYGVIQDCGWKALPIVSLISLLVGLILAFMGAVQLKMFGAQIYIADLVGIGMTREMGAVMTGVIMSGRTGAAFAANLGTMQVNEEIDALQTLGVPPMDYLVLPRVVALVLMMPLLCLYADFMGLLGGMLVGVGAFDISAIQYLTQTGNALSVTHISVGVFKSVFFGLIVAIAGCMQGLRCGRSAAAVGNATTSAVVIAIIYIVVADGIFAVLTNVVGI